MFSMLIERRSKAQLAEIANVVQLLSIVRSEHGRGLDLFLLSGRGERSSASIPIGAGSRLVVEGIKAIGEWPLEHRKWNAGRSLRYLYLPVNWSLAAVPD